MSHVTYVCKGENRSGDVTRATSESCHIRVTFIFRGRGGIMSHIYVGSCESCRVCVQRKESEFEYVECDAWHIRDSCRTCVC